MNIQEYVELNTFSTFMVQSQARYFTTVASVVDIQELITTEVWKNNKRYILGEGSNTLFVNDIEHLVVKNAIEGLEVVSEDDNSMALRVGAGENWHNLVMWSVNQKLWGIENLVLIPGTVGASPVQNIGAYGMEVADAITKVEAIDVETGKVRIFSNEECSFNYRDSIFKHYPEKWIITHVWFLLSKIPNPILSYDRVSQELDGDIELTSQVIAEAIVRIRDTKLPRIGDLGTAGSFFKNPVVSLEKAEILHQQYPEMKQYDVEGGKKISAAWLIDCVGFKGYTEGSVGTYEKHALVLVNHGGASGDEVRIFAQKIVDKVKEVFGITLEPEINIIS